MQTRLRSFIVQQRARGMSAQAIRRALGLAPSQELEAALFGAEEEAGRAPGAGAAGGGSGRRDRGRRS